MTHKYASLAATASLLSMILMAATSAHAVDGVIEINQASAAAGSITPGDSPGFPVTLSEIGSYRLTGNLVITDSTTDGIEITKSFVTLDLNGFTISGPGNGSGDGITAENKVSNVTALNGIVQGMGGIGVRLLGPGSRAQMVSSLDNGSFGFQLRLRGRVESCVASGNGDTGIIVAKGGLVMSSMAGDNGGDGIAGGGACGVFDNTATGNVRDGISAITGCVVKGNSAQDNMGFGLRLGGTVGYAHNVIFSNNQGNVIGGSQIGDNLCDNSTLCP